jgi:hypothetical protein
MKRAVDLVPLISFVTMACTHDWSLPLTGDDAGTNADAALADVAVVDAASEAGAFDCSGSIFCDAFDTDSPLTPLWDDIARGESDSKVEKQRFAGARSAPNVLFVERPAQTGGASTAFVSKVLTQSLKKVRIELDISPSALDPSEYATLAAIVLGDGTSVEHKLRLTLNRDAAQIQEIGPSAVIASHDLPAAFPIDAWTHVAFEIEVGGRVRASVDASTNAVDDPAASTWQASTRTRIVAGVNFVKAPHQDVRVRIDNVRVDGS